MCTKVLQALVNCIKFFTFRLFKMLLRLTSGIRRSSVHKCLWILIIVTVIMYFACKYNLRSKNWGGAKLTPKHPVIMWWTSNFGGFVGTRTCARNIKCDMLSDRNESHAYKVEAYLFYGSQIKINDLPPRNSEDVWGLYHEESPRNLEELMHEPMLSLFNFSATFSRHSNVPFPLQYLESLEAITDGQHFVPTKIKNMLLTEIAPVMYLQSDCETSTERDSYVKELMKHIEIDSYGACLKNKELPEKFTGDYLNNLNENDFLDFVARYKFVIAIENGVCEDYITEKFWRPIKVGSVPIYFGSPSIKDWFPNDKSAILLDDFTTPEILSKHLKKLLANDSLYEEYLEHKTKQIITNTKLVKELKERPYQTDGLDTVERFECFICEQLHNKTNIGSNIVNKSHYNCPKPISALTLSVNPTNHWVYSWDYARKSAEQLYKQLTN
ncbi:alpha-(1,3)-fucosyltransferase 10 [Ostrinia nubilalis]|uniref:alpha-(1,3)-fucosyltransferase 10 n=1 Tax=Ostrinia nubilalis TaxID=29057 RepID=UPI00308230C7